MFALRRFVRHRHHRPERLRSSQSIQSKSMQSINPTHGRPSLTDSSRARRAIDPKSPPRGEARSNRRSNRRFSSRKRSISIRFDSKRLRAVERTNERTNERTRVDDRGRPRRGLERDHRPTDRPTNRARARFPRGGVPSRVDGHAIASTICVRLKYIYI